MNPARQRLEADDRSGLDVHQRLVEQPNSPVCERLAQVDFQGPPSLHDGVHARLEEAVAAAPIRLRLIQRQVGIFHDLIGIFAVVRDHGDANAGADQ